MKVSISPENCTGEVNGKILDLDELIFTVPYESDGDFAFHLHFNTKKPNEIDILEIPLTKSEAIFLAKSILNLTQENESKSERIL